MFKFKEDNQWLTTYEADGYYMTIEKCPNSHRPVYLTPKGKYYPEMYIVFKNKKFD